VVSAVDIFKISGGLSQEEATIEEIQYGPRTWLPQTDIFMHVHSVAGQFL
jgi:hypothetical protein